MDLKVTNNRHIIIGGEAKKFQVAFVKNRKRISIVVNDRGEIQVRCPPGTPMRQVDALLTRETDWLDGHLNQRLKNKRQTLQDGAPLPFLGDCLTLRLAPWGRGSVFRCGDDLWITRVDPDDVDTNLDIRRPLERWYLRHAQAYFPSRLTFWARIMGVSFNNLNVRNQRTRWGSCSSRGNINLNWRLMWASPRVVDYVLVHELTHRRHMNHSPAFWQAVQSLIPDYQECRNLLKSLGSPW